MTLIIRKPATNEQISQMAEIYDGVLIKLAVDVEREILAGGGAIHGAAMAMTTKASSNRIPAREVGLVSSLLTILIATHHLLSSGPPSAPLLQTYPRVNHPVEHVHEQVTEHQDDTAG